MTTVEKGDYHVFNKVKGKSHRIYGRSAIATPRAHGVSAVDDLRANVIAETAETVRLQRTQYFQLR